MAEFRVQIPQEMLAAGYPVEWVVISDDGTVTIHYSSPVLLENMTVDDRKILNLADGLKYLIGCGQTVEIQMRSAFGAKPTLIKCKCGSDARCNHRCFDAGGACTRVLGHAGACGEGGLWRVVPSWYWVPGELDQVIRTEGPVDHDGFCRICGQKSYRADLMNWLAQANATPRAKDNTKATRELARARRRLNKKGRTDG